MKRIVFPSRNDPRAFLLRAILNNRCVLDYFLETTWMGGEGGGMILLSIKCVAGYILLAQIKITKRFSQINFYRFIQIE